MDTAALFDEIADARMRSRLTGESFVIYLLGDVALVTRLASLPAPENSKAIVTIHPKGFTLHPELPP